MSTTAQIPVEEYPRHTEKPNCEYKDGVLYPKGLPTKFHSIIQRVLMTLLQQILQNEGVQAFPELTVRTSPTRYLVPDIAVAGDFPGPYTTEPVLLCSRGLNPATVNLLQ